MNKETLQDEAISSRLNHANLTEEEARIIDFIVSYSFKDSKEVYTNGTTLVPLYRVLDAILQKGEPYQEKLCSRHECRKHTESPSPMEGKTPLKGWVNVYRKPNDKRNYLSIVWPQKDFAEQSTHGMCIAIIDLSKHYEGEGL